MTANTVSVTEFMGRVKPSSASGSNSGGNSPVHSGKPSMGDLVRVPSTVPVAEPIVQQKSHEHTTEPVHVENNNVTTATHQMLHNGAAIAGHTGYHLEQHSNPTTQDAAQQQYNEALGKINKTSSTTFEQQQTQDRMNKMREQLEFQAKSQQTQVVHEVQVVQEQTQVVQQPQPQFLHQVQQQQQVQLKKELKSEKKSPQQQYAPSNYADKREGLLKGNLKVVYEQVGELFKENKSLREEVELSKLKIANLQAMLEEKSTSYDLLLEKIQNRATCSNEDFGEKLAMLGLESANSSESRDGREVKQRDDNGDYLTGSLNAPTESTTPTGTESTTSSIIGVRHVGAPSSRESTPRGGSSMVKVPSDDNKLTTGFTAGSRTKSFSKNSYSNEVSDRDRDRNHLIFSPRAEALRAADSRPRLRSSRVESDSEYSGSSKPFAPIKLMPDSAIFAKLNTSNSKNNYDHLRLQHDASATSTNGGVTLPPGLGLEMSGSAVSATSHASFQHSGQVSGNQIQSQSFSQSQQLVKKAGQSLGETRNQLIYLCEKHDVDVRTVEWFLLPENCIYWETLAMKLEEIDRRATMQDGHFKVKNPSAWLTKFFNTIRKNNTNNNNDPSSQSSNINGNTSHFAAGGGVSKISSGGPHTPTREPLKHHASAGGMPQQQHLSSGVSVSTRATSTFFPSSGLESN